MINRSPLQALTLTCMLLCAAPLRAQETQPEPGPDPDAPAEAGTPGGQEVEVNEDYYRQFMELKDPLQPREVMPDTAFKPQSGLKKWDDLPETSQKHLREQLREIIVGGAPWQPGDENRDYPLVPSPAAESDASLRQLEAEAWDELVDNYHDREAVIHANAARARGMSGADTTGQPTGDGTGAGQASATAEPSSAGPSGESADAYRPSPSSAGNGSTTGVTQSAMDFLSSSHSSSSQDAGGAESRTAAAMEPPASDRAPGQPGTNRPDVSAAGATQNALERLRREAERTNGGQPGPDGQDENGTAMEAPAPESARTGVPDERPDQAPRKQEEPGESTEGVSQSALEYLSGKDAEPADEETLSIEDLLNARGLKGDPASGDPEKDDGGPRGDRR